MSTVFRDYGQNLSVCWKTAQELRGWVWFKFITAFNASWTLTKNLNKSDVMMLFCLFVLVSGPVEADPEYRLIVAANNLTVEIDNELSELAVLWFYNNKCKGFNVVILCLTEFPFVFLPGFQISFTSLLGINTPRGSQSSSLWCRILLITSVQSRWDELF